jgi:carboxymethylenebutenolidase
METETTLSSAWDQHIASEFAAKSAEQALATMTDEPYVNEVPLMIGARGRKELHDFYANHFLNQIPPDMEMVPVSRTIGQGRVVDELIGRFTHSIRMDWILPGIEPTGKRVELPFVVIVQFESNKLAHEHLYWDQASVLVQVGLLDRLLDCSIVDIEEILTVVKQVRDHVEGMTELGERRRELITEALAGAVRRVEESELLREALVELRARERLLLETLANYRQRHGRGCGCDCCRAAGRL